MKTFHLVVFFLLFHLFPLNLIAQEDTQISFVKEKKNTFQLHVKGIHLPIKNNGSVRPVYFNGEVIRQVGWLYERRIKHNWIVGVQYDFWLPSKHNTYLSDFRILGSIPDFSKEYNEQTLSGMRDYHFTDVHVGYKFYLHPLHRFTIKQAFSMARGKNVYLTPTVREEKTEIFAGGITAAHYDLLLWKGNINAGVNLSCSYYVGLPFVIYNYGLHIGYNF